VVAGVVASVEAQVASVAHQQVVAEVAHQQVVASVAHQQVAVLEHRLQAVLDLHQVHQHQAEDLDRVLIAGQERLPLHQQLQQ
jgi:hypothetical protein